MNGIKLLLLLAASAQVEAGTERDYGWSVNKEDGVLEYIVQINPDKKLLMEQRSVQFPKGQESTSNMPRELVGRASRVVVRFGNEILPREPSLQELDRAPRLFEQPSVSAAAVLGEDRFRDLESPVRNIQGQGSASAFPTIPNGLAGGTDSLGQTTNSLRNDLNEKLSDALPNSSMPGRNMPDPSTLAQNFPSQTGGADAFLGEARGGASGLGSRFNNTAPAATPPLNSANPVTNPPANASPRFPEFPQTPSTNSAFPSSNQGSANTANRNTGLGNGLGTNGNTAPLYPADRLNPPSLNNQTSLPQQETPSSTFGSSPGFPRRTPNDWNSQANQNVPASSMSQQYDNYNYGGAQNFPPVQNATQVALNTPPYVATNNSNVPGRQPNTGNLTTSQLEVAMAVREKLDKNKDGNLTPDEYTPAGVDGILLTLFVLSLLVNLYLGHLIRKLLMRYRMVLTNVRSQAAFT